MTDIVERLREQAGWYSDGHGPLHKEAADEIERLLAEIEKLRAAHAFAIKVHDVKMKGSPARWSEPPEV